MLPTLFSSHPIMLCNMDSSQLLPANGCQGSHAHQSSQLILHRHAAMEAVVMETGESAAAADGTVTMEIAAAAPAERADTEVQRAGAAFPDRNYRMLIVIGELCNSHHLDAVRNQIAQGKTSGGGGGGWSDDLSLNIFRHFLSSQNILIHPHVGVFESKVKELIVLKIYVSLCIVYIYVDPLFKHNHPNSNLAFHEFDIRIFSNQTFSCRI